jgi:hypothetical protein
MIIKVKNNLKVGTHGADYSIIKDMKRYFGQYLDVKMIKQHKRISYLMIDPPGYGWESSWVELQNQDEDNQI